MLDEQEKADIRMLYRYAADKRSQIRILTELYLVSREEILDVLGDLVGPEALKPSRKGLPKRSYSAEFKEEAKQQLRAGKGIRQVAREMGVNSRTVANWAYYVRRDRKGEDGKL